MEIPLVFLGNEDLAYDDELIVSFTGTDPVDQLRNEIQKRLMMMTETNDLKLLLELNRLTGNPKAGNDFNIRLWKDRSTENESYSFHLSLYRNRNYGKPSWLKLIRDKFGKKLSLKAKCRFIESRKETPTMISYSTAESGIVLSEDEDGSFDTQLTFKECTSCPELKDELDLELPILSLILCFETDAAPKGKLTDQCADINDKMLKMELFTDAVIVSESGKEFKCHKSFLVAHSPVLQAMLLSGMEESRTSRIQVPDLSEKVVEAFLQYLYTRDTSEVAGNCELCFGLLYAAHKYEVKCLEGHAIELLQRLKSEDYPLDIVLKLFLFLGNAIPGSEDLKKRTAGIMKRKLDALAALPEYVDLFKRNPEGAMELTKYLATA